jgi:hypothetical protein
MTTLQKKFVADATKELGRGWEVKHLDLARLPDDWEIEQDYDAVLQGFVKFHWLSFCLAMALPPESD